MKNIHILPTDKPSRLTYLNDKLVFDKKEVHITPLSQNIYITSDEEIKEGDLGTDGTVVGYYGLDDDNCPILKDTKHKNVYNFSLAPHTKKIILTTDQDLINDGVQAIDDEFLEWFVKNPNCEFVEMERIIVVDTLPRKNLYDYKIIIPEEEPKQDETEHLLSTEANEKRLLEDVNKQETLEEAAYNEFPNQQFYGSDEWTVTQRICGREGFKKGAKWQLEQNEIEQLLKLQEIELKWMDYFSEGFDKGVEETEKNMYSKEDLKKAFLSGCQSERKFKPRIKCWEEFIEQFKKK